jgi:glycosyltransferase involved in cell wall biosynthesis
MLQKVIANRGIPVVIWVHAIDGMWWYRRLFNFEASAEFYQYVKYNIPHMLRLRRLFRRANQRPQEIRLVFVSQWIRRVAETDTMTRLRESEVIPNPVDTDRFPYRRKDPVLRTQVLLVRPFNSRKYANDIAVAAILELRKFPEFEEFHFSIVGSGKLFAAITAPLVGLKNVTLYEGFRTHEEIRAMHDIHGVLLAPTRQDSHGVTTSEAMSSGLVPITSRSSAVPEFVTHNETGFLTNDKQDIVNAFRQLYRDPDLFRRLSHAAAIQARIQCGIESVIPRELAVLAGTARAH